MIVTVMFRNIIEMHWGKIQIKREEIKNKIKSEEKCNITFQVYRTYDPTLLQQNEITTNPYELKTKQNKTKTRKRRRDEGKIKIGSMWSVHRVGPYEMHVCGKHFEKKNSLTDNSYHTQDFSASNVIRIRELFHVILFFFFNTL